MRLEDPKPGTTRVVKKFLLVPVKISGETRWLETARIMQLRTHQGWVNLKFIKPEAIEEGITGENK